MKLGLIGAGKRMVSVYVPLLKKLSTVDGLDLTVVGFTTRKQSTADSFHALTGLKHYKTRDDLVGTGIDAFLVCVPPDATCSVIDTSLKYGLYTMVETPIYDASIVQRIDASDAVVSVLEQWPYLPLEQLKESVYSAGLMKRPYMVQNDCRSYDYHAMAQLRTYLGRSKQAMIVNATSGTFQLSSYDNAGTIVQPATDAWEVATVTFSDGSLLLHNFAYACKTAPFRSIQTLRGYSSNGTIVTGRIFDRNDDTEIIDIRYVDAVSSITKSLGVKIDRSNDGTLQALSTDVPSVSWTNAFPSLQLSDAEQALTKHISHAVNAVKTDRRPLYDIRESIMDQLLVTAIKQSTVRGTLRLK